jgi:hypothetical protein
MLSNKVWEFLDVSCRCPMSMSIAENNSEKKRNGYEKAYGLAVIDKPHVFSGKANEPKICIMGKKE